MKVIFFAYRDWALKVINHFIYTSDKKLDVELVISKVEDYFKLESYKKDSIDYVVLLGWSHIIKQPLLSQFNFIGVHPSNLPDYAGGSPLQHQIIDGVKDTYCSLFRITDQIDEGDVIHRFPLSLSGDSISDVFNNLTGSTITLLEEFLDGKNLSPVINTRASHETLKRRTPKQSKIDFQLINVNNIEPLYNFIRALTDPYPNAFLEDDLGNKLYIEKIRYERSKKLD